MQSTSPQRPLDPQAAVDAAKRAVDLMAYVVAATASDSDNRVVFRADEMRSVLESFTQVVQHSSGVALNLSGAAHRLADDETLYDKRENSSAQRTTETIANKLICIAKELDDVMTTGGLLKALLESTYLQNEPEKSKTGTDHVSPSVTD